MSVDHSMRAQSESVREKTSAVSQMSVPMRLGQQQRSQELELRIQATTRRS